MDEEKTGQTPSGEITKRLLKKKGIVSPKINRTFTVKKGLHISIPDRIKNVKQLKIWKEEKIKQYTK